MGSYTHAYIQLSLCFLLSILPSHFAPHREVQLTARVGGEEDLAGWGGGVLPLYSFFGWVGNGHRRQVLYLLRCKLLFSCVLNPWVGGWVGMGRGRKEKAKKEKKTAAVLRSIEWVKCSSFLLFLLLRSHDTTTPHPPTRIHPPPLSSHRPLQPNLPTHSSPPTHPIFHERKVECIERGRGRGRWVRRRGGRGNWVRRGRLFSSTQWRCI